MTDKTRIDQIQELWDSHIELRKGASQNNTLHYQKEILTDSVGFLLEGLKHLSLNDYQHRARETAIYPKENAIDYCTMKLGSEAGEVLGKVAKRYRDDDGKLTEVRLQALKKEIGDVLWYVAVLSYELGFSLEDIAQANLDSLSDRKERGTLKGDGDNR